MHSLDFAKMLERGTIELQQKVGKGLPTASTKY